jgi:hypothetical protein
MVVHRESGAQRAVKVLRKVKMGEDEKRMLFNEINILRELVSLKIEYFLLYAKTFAFAEKFEIALIISGPSQHCQNVRILRGQQTLLSGHRVSKLSVKIMNFF